MEREKEGGMEGGMVTEQCVRFSRELVHSSESCTYPVMHTENVARGGKLSFQNVEGAKVYTMC